MGFKVARVPASVVFSNPIPVDRLHLASVDSSRPASVDFSAVPVRTRCERLSSVDFSVSASAALSACRLEQTGRSDTGLTCPGTYSKRAPGGIRFRSIGRYVPKSR